MIRTHANPAAIQSRRRGVITMAVVLSLIVVLGCVALALDRVWLANAKNELQTCADAAALAAAQELACDDRLRTDADWPARLRFARLQADRIARKSIVAGRPAVLDLDGVRFGHLLPSDEGTIKFYTTAYKPTTVVVTAQRTRANNNPVAVLLRNAFGKAHADVVARGEASIDNHIVGVRPLPGTTVPALPLAIRQSGVEGERQAWDVAIDAKLGQDAYRYDPVTKSVESGADGLPEILLRSKAADEETSDANVHLVDLNTDLRSDPLLAQIADGWTPAALAPFGGAMLFHEGPQTLRSAAAFGTDVAWALEQLIGECRICLLYEECQSTGRGNYGILRAVGLVAGRVMSVQHEGDGSCRIVFQPGVIATRTVVLAEGAFSAGAHLSDAERRLLENPYVYKLHLTH